MDIAVTNNKKPHNYRRYGILLIIAVPLIFIVNYLWFLGKADFSINEDLLVVDEVKRGKYTASVRGTGLLVPDNIQWLSASVDGTVIRRVIKAGNIVKEGDLILELSNPQLVQQLAEAQYELEAMKAELEAARVVEESTIQQQKSNVLNAKLDYETSKYEYEARAALIKTGAVSQLDYQRTFLVRDQFKQRWLSSQEQLNKMEETMTAQNNARAARLNQTMKNVAMVEQQVSDLQVRATMDSIALEVPLEPGQRVTIGDNIAKLAQQDSLIAELLVPEIQIRDVTIGQRVIIDTRNNKIQGVVSRIDPAVVNGNVKVDVNFSDELPDDARPDLSVDGEIKITEIADTLYVNRPIFAQSRSRAAFYKLSKDGKFAERVEVQLGYGSVNQIQIIDGLKVGDRIITSAPTRFETYEKFRIN